MSIRSRGNLRFVKLLRFELLAEPGRTRSGIVHGGKVYETDGTQAIGVHEWGDVVPLVPTGTPPSYRMFRLAEGGADWGLHDEPIPLYFYLNPASLVPANRQLVKPIHVGELGYEPQLAAVVASPGSNVEVSEADGIILGLTVLNTFVDLDIERAERASGAGPGRSRDFATAAGPFLTTPEELDDLVIDDSRGRRYNLSASIRINGQEVGSADLSQLPFTFAELISSASESCSLAAGDLVALGPIGVTPSKKSKLEIGDDVQVIVERLGRLGTHIAN